MTRKVVASMFVEEARKALDFLVTDFSFEGYEADRDVSTATGWITYYSPRILVECVLEPRGGVSTRVRLASRMDEWVSLESIMSVVGLAPPKGMFALATTMHGLRTALAAQAEALRVILPLLNEPGGEAIIEQVSL